LILYMWVLLFKLRCTSDSSCFSGKLTYSIVENTVIDILQNLFEISEQTKRQNKSRETEYITVSMDLLRQIQTLQRQIKTAKNEKLTLYNKYSDGDMTKDEYLSQRSSKESQINELSEQIAELEEKRHEKSIFVSQYIGYLCDLSFSGELNREIVDKLLDKVIVYDANRIEVKWNFSDNIILTI